MAMAWAQRGVQPEQRIQAATRTGAGEEQRHDGGGAWLGQSASAGR
jgi:hypothetical protein